MTRKQIVKLTDTWQTKLGLDNWEVIIFFKDYSRNKYKNSAYDVAATTLSNHQYKLGSIYYNPKMLHCIDEDVVIHELLHLLCSPLVETARQHAKKGRQNEDINYFNEQLVSELTRIILRAAA